MTDTQLQLAIARLLPEKLGIQNFSRGDIIYWKSNPDYEEIEVILDNSIKPTEWEHIVRLVEERMTGIEQLCYITNLLSIDAFTPFKEILTLERGWKLSTASWQQRATAILKVKGVL